MNFIQKMYQNTLNIERSEFIALIFPLNAKEELHEILKNMRKTYPKATHYTYAYILGNLGDTAASSDDGEPSGTAGMPILDVLKKNEMTNILCVVIRYFGGIKLGAGGLIRAYSSATSHVLSSATIYEQKKIFIYEAIFDYPYIDRLLKIIPEKQIMTTSYLESVRIVFYLLNQDLSFLNEYQHLILISYIGEDDILFEK